MGPRRPLFQEMYVLYDYIIWVMFDLAISFRVAKVLTVYV